MNLTILIVTMIAGLGAGIATGLAGLSAAAVITPMLVTLLGFNAYEAVGISLASDVLASAVSAFTYYKHKNLDIRNGLIMMISTVIFTMVGSWLGSLVPQTTLGSFSVWITMILAGQERQPQKSDPHRETESIVITGLRRPDRSDLRLYRRRRRHDDAAGLSQRAGLRFKNGGRHQRVHHDVYCLNRCSQSFCDQRHDPVVPVDQQRLLHLSGRDDRRALRQQGGTEKAQSGHWRCPVYSGRIHVGDQISWLILNLETSFPIRSFFIG